MKMYQRKLAQASEIVPQWHKMPGSETVRNIQPAELPTLKSPNWQEGSPLAQLLRQLVEGAFSRGELTPADYTMLCNQVIPTADPLAAIFQAGRNVGRGEGFREGMLSNEWRRLLVETIGYDPLDK